MVSWAIQQEKHGGHPRIDEFPSPDSPGISPDQRSERVFHIISSLCRDDPVIAHIENFRFGRFGDKSAIFRGRWFRWEIDPPLMIYKKTLPRHKSTVCEGTGGCSLQAGFAWAVIKSLQEFVRSEKHAGCDMRRI